MRASVHGASPRTHQGLLHPPPAVCAFRSCRCPRLPFLEQWREGGFGNASTGMADVAPVDTITKIISGEPPATTRPGMCSALERCAPRYAPCLPCPLPSHRHPPFYYSLSLLAAVDGMHMVVAREPNQQELYLPAPPVEDDPDFALVDTSGSGSGSGSGGELVIYDDPACHPSTPGYPYTCRIVPPEAPPVSPINGTASPAPMPTHSPRSPIDPVLRIMVAGSVFVWGAALLYYLRNRVRLSGGRPRSPGLVDHVDHLPARLALADGPATGEPTDLAAGPGVAPGVFGDLVISEEVRGACICACGCVFVF